MNRFRRHPGLPGTDVSPDAHLPLVRADLAVTLAAAYDGSNKKELARQFGLTQRAVTLALSFALTMDVEQADDSVLSDKMDRASPLFHTKLAQHYNGLILGRHEIDVIRAQIDNGTAEIIQTGASMSTLYAVTIHRRDVGGDQSGPLFVRADNDTRKLITACDPEGFQFSPHRGWEMKAGWKPKRSTFVAPVSSPDSTDLS